MPSKNTLAKRDERARKRAKGLKPHEIWCKPSQWPAIQAYCQQKAREELIKGYEDKE